MLCRIDPTNATIHMPLSEFLKLSSDQVNPSDNEEFKLIAEFLMEGEGIDGSHHKQWYICQAIDRLCKATGMTIPSHEEPGINP